MLEQKQPIQASHFLLLQTVNGSLTSLDLPYALNIHGEHDAVEFRYYDIDKSAWVPVQCDDELRIIFAIHDSFLAKLESVSYKGKVDS